MPKNKYLKLLLIIVIILIIFYVFNLNKSKNDYTTNDLLAITSNIYKKIPVSSTDFNLADVDYNLSSKEVIKSLNYLNKGVWCSGAADILSKAFNEMGLDSYVLSYGKHNVFSHAVVLVKLKNHLWIFDPYLNYTYEKSFKGVVDDLLDGKKPRIRNGESSYRKVIYNVNINKIDEIKKSSWTYDPNDHTIRCSTIDAQNSMCMVKHSLNLFKSRFIDSNKDINNMYNIIDDLSLNIPHDPSAYILFPYMISGKDGTIEVKDYKSSLNDGVFRELIEYIKLRSNYLLNPEKSPLEKQP